MFLWQKVTAWVLNKTSRKIHDVVQKLPRPVSVCGSGLEWGAGGTNVLVAVAAARPRNSVVAGGWFSLFATRCIKIGILTI